MLFYNRPQGEGISQKEVTTMKWRTQISMSLKEIREAREALKKCRELLEAAGERCGVTHKAIKHLEEIFKED